MIEEVLSMFGWCILFIGIIVGLFTIGILILREIGDVIKAASTLVGFIVCTIILGVGISSNIKSDDKIRDELAKEHELYTKILNTEVEDDKEVSNEQLSLCIAEHNDKCMKYQNEVNENKVLYWLFYGGKLSTFDQYIVKE